MNIDTKQAATQSEQDAELAKLFKDIGEPVDHYFLFASSFQLTKHQLRMLTSSLQTQDLYTVLELLKAKNHKSQFRASLSMQIRKWLDVNASVPIEQIKTVPQPLSIRQMQRATPTWPVHYNIPSFK